MKSIKQWIDDRVMRKFMAKRKRQLFRPKDHKVEFNEIYEAADEKSANQLLDNIFDKHHGW